uniref:Uncharacterized protein n=1 Tax=Cacopsylla melanoneura TaxID=428564 RepID=A0A8D9B4D4_9HEMI
MFTLCSFCTKFNYDYFILFNSFWTHFIQKPVQGLIALWSGIGKTKSLIIKKKKINLKFFFFYDLITSYSTFYFIYSICFLINMYVPSSHVVVIYLPSFL